MTSVKFTPRKLFVKVVAFVLSLIITFYAIPCTIFADLIKTSSNGEAEEQPNGRRKLRG